MALVAVSRQVGRGLPRLPRDLFPIFPFARKVLDDYMILSYVYLASELRALWPV